jgi:hypothetical protein
MTGDALLTDGARAMLLSRPTPALFTCENSRCAHSLLTWQAELPAQAWDSARSWPKCPERHRARLVDVCSAPTATG